jgi:dTDP-4-dehydrorhamnose 3,5-epimerase
MSNEIELTPTALPEVLIINSNLFNDDRGNFSRAFDSEMFKDQLGFQLSQINICLTKDVGTIRGLHFQTKPFQEQKIVRCLSGAILDVAVDVRPESPTYLKHVQVELSSENNTSLLIPKGFAHGYQTLQQNSTVLYFTSQIYMPSNEKGLRFDDPKLNIKWNRVINKISEKDMNWPLIGMER